MSVNKVTIVGRVGQDPELKFTPSGAAVCNFSVATSERYKDKSENWQEKTEWHRVVVWGKLAEVCNQKLSKGDKVYLEGKLEYRQWDDKNGVKHTSAEVKVTTMEVMESKKNDTGSKKEEVQEDLPTFAADDVPF
jgi:single-strand DNA-binding protein